MGNKTLKWSRPSGKTIETNDLPATVKAAVDKGWVPAKAADTAPDKDANGMPWDERLHQKNKALDDDGIWKYKKGVNAESAAALLAADE